MTKYDPNQKNPDKNRNTTIIIAVIVVLCICLAVAAILGTILLLRISSQNKVSTSSNDWGGAMTLIYRLDGQKESLSGYIYDLEETEIMLPAGRYYAEMKLANGTLMAFNPLIINDEKGGKGAADFKQRVSKPISSEEAAQQIDTLVRFLVGVDTVRLTYFEIISDGFTQPLFSNQVELSWADEQALMNTLANLGDAQEVSAAVSAFIARAEAAKAFQPAKPGLSAPKSGLISSVLSFFGIMDEENDLARQQVLEMYAAINKPEEKEESFWALDERQAAGSANFDEFIQKVQNGEIKDMVKVRRNLMEMGPMEGIMQSLHPESNRPGGEIIHRVGAEAVRRGAELNVEIIKEVLTTTFPGMDQGFDYADKVNEWAEFVHQVYTDPLQAASDELQGQATDAINERIKNQFLTLFPDMDEDDVDELVDRVTQQLTESVSTLVDNEDEELPLVTQEEVALSETDQDDDDYEEVTETATETETSEATPTEESSEDSSGPPAPQEEIALPGDLAEQQNDQDKGDNSDFIWNATWGCWDYIGPAYEGYTWSCANQCFNYKDQDWNFDCTTDCPVYIGPKSDVWAWDCQTNCWQYILPNYTYNCATKCLEYTGPDAHLWYWDCNRNCMEYIGPPVDGYTWSCEMNRWLED